FDIYLTNISDSYRCPLFVNTGNGRFVNRAAEAGVDDTGWAWGTEFFDCDHDGDVELYVVNGFKIDPGHNFFFDNTLMETGVARYVDVSSISGTDGEYEARGLVVFDHDNDGDLDLLVANWWDPPYLYANQTRTHNWLKVKLRGTVSNRFGVGATVTVRIGEQALHRANDGVEFLGQSIQPVHFGVGNAEVVDEIRVRWPSGVEDVRHEVATNQSIEIVEGEVTAVTSPASPGQPDRFELHGNFPNPFNGETIIEFSLPRAGQVQLTIFDVLGNIVYQATRVFTAGRHRFKWHGTGQDGAPLSTGFYFYSVATSGQRQMGKLLYLK
ncbi:MAG: T9SS C-terminal target domain-containing protein, partial [Candidatus Zixiibacteriota bacterium]